MRPGRLLILAEESDGIDRELGITVAVDPHKTKFAKVVKTSDADEFPIGCTVMYDRVHGSEITLDTDEENSVEFMVITTADVSLKIME